MDRSIDSIGSCSLDADSTDFSDTSESLNFISPSATREDFTAGIAERVRKIQTTQPLTPKLILNQPTNNQQRSATAATTTAFFDINSGKISTIVSRAETNGCYFNGSTEKFLSTKTIDLQSPTVVAHANKKPSYLNLACCVNGYSNYTNYDSVERKEINKSRDVSPIRPIITMARQQRSSDNLLSVPAPVTFIKQSPMTSITKRFASLDINDKDTIDNAGIINGNGSVSNRKSFIQQRVEKLYGTTKILTSSTTTTTTTKTFETKHTNGNYHHHNHHHSNGLNGSSPAGREIEIEEKENDEELYMNSLPVMKHLRPEFCRQLQFMNSPKKTQRNFAPASENNGIQTDNKISAAQQEIQNSSKIKENSIEKANLQSNNKEIVMERIINHSEPQPSEEIVTEKSETNNVDLSNNNDKSVCSKNIEIETTNASLKEVKDGYYFLRLLFSEKARILKMADETEKELELLQSDPSTVPTEEVVGLVLAAIGKSRLLATKKFKQFEGLCEENLNPSADGPQTLSGDLQGFWDMMMLQVENVDESYKEIQTCRENGWTKPQPPSPQAPKGSRLTKRPLTQAQNGKAKSVAANNATTALKKPSTAPSNSEAAQKREEQRKKLLEMKKKHKAAMLQQNGTSENEIVNGDKKENGENGDVEMIL